MFSSDPIDMLNIKLKRIKKYFKGWDSNLFGHNKKKKIALKDELQALETLEEISELSPEAYERKSMVQVELQELHAEDEMLWLQRSHERWLLQGDNNTSFFHKVANGRKGKKYYALTRRW